MDVETSFPRVKAVVTVYNCFQSESVMCAGEQGSEQDDGLVFLYKLCRGAAPKSYGLQVWACLTLLEILDTLLSQTGPATIVL